MMSASPCPSAHHAAADEVLYGDENNKFVQPVVNSTSPYMNHLTTVQSEVSQIVTSSQTYKHFLAQKYAAESTSDADADTHSANALSHASQTFQHQISSFYTFSPLVSSSSHFDTRGILGDDVLESSVDSLQVESSTSEPNSGHSSQVIFNTIDNFIKQEEAASLVIQASANSASVTSTSARATAASLLAQPNLLYDTVAADGAVDSTTTANISTSSTLNPSLTSYAFNNYQSSTSHQPTAPLSSVLTYGLSPSFPATLLHLDTPQPLLPSLPSPSIQIDNYFNQPGSLDKRDDNVLLEQHQLLPGSIQPNYASDASHCLLPDNLADNFLHDMPNETFAENDILPTAQQHENVISDVPVLTRARASLPIEYLYLHESDVVAGELGVFARKLIPARTQFGPIEGVIAAFKNDGYFSLSSIAFNTKTHLNVFISETVLLSQEDENNSNWTRFVRPAPTAMEQNMELITKEYASANELKFFFYTTRSIMPNEELKVWYSQEYCDRFDIKSLDEADPLNILAESELDVAARVSANHQPSPENLATTGGHKLRNKIAKSQLSQLHQSQVALQEGNKSQDQLASHDGLEQSLNSNELQELFNTSLTSVSVEPKVGANLPTSVKAADNSSPAGGIAPANDLAAKPGSKEGKNQYKCSICERVFPRHYSLRRHLVMHSGEKKYKCPVCGMAFNHVYNRNRHLKKHNKENGDMMEATVSVSNGEEKTSEASAAGCIQSSSNKNDESLLANESSNSDVGSVPSAAGAQSLFKPDNDSNNNFIDSNNENHHFEPKSIDSAKSSSSSLTVSSESSSCCDNVSSTICAKLDDSPPSHSLTISKIGIDKPFRCNQCYKRFSTQERLDKHQMVHDETAKHLSCEICKRKFLTNSALSCHVKTHNFSTDEPRKYDCTLCGELFETIQLRREHVVVHINPETGLYHCSKCPKTFDDFSPIRKHIKSFHSEEIFPCPQCEKSFPRQDKLRLHMLCHSDRWEFKCNFCSKQFKRKDKLKEHTQRMHAPDRDVRIAAKLAARMQRLKAQRTKKIATKPSQPNYHEYMYKCHQCLLGFKRRGMLVNHLAKRHPDVPYNSVPELNMPIVKTSKDYYCQYCDKVYKSSSKRKAHIMKNHPGKALPASNRNKGVVPTGIPNPTFSATVGSILQRPHFCDWCHKQYASKAKLMQHQRKKHADKVTASSKSTKGEINFTCTSESSVGSLKLDSIASSSDKSPLDVCHSDSMTITLPPMKPDHGVMDHYKSQKLESFLSGAPTVTSHQFIDNFGLSSQYTKNGTFLSGSTLQQAVTQYTIDPHDQSLEDLLNITMVGDEANSSMLINNSAAHSSSSSSSSMQNNIITILTCTVPSGGTTFSNDLDIMQITDFPGSKMLSTNQTSALSSEPGSGNLMMPDAMEESNWSQVCEEMAMV